MSETASHYSFAYQPIVDADQASVAVELHYRVQPAADGDPAFAAANTIINAFIHSGLDDLLRHRRAYIPVTPELLDSELLHLLPADHVAIEITAASLLDDSCRNPCQALRAAGYTLVLDATGEAPPPLDLIDSFDVVALDGQAVAAGHRAAWLERLRPFPARLLARHVDTPALYQALRHQGFGLYQGYYFAHRAEASGRRVDPHKLALIDIIARIEDDQDDHVIEEAFKHDPGLSLHLLRLVNSSAFALHTRVSSIKHAMIVLGRRQLARWLQLLLFALDGSAAGNSPLMELALRRARFMEYVLTYRTHHSSTRLQDAAYVVGLLSLADVVLDWPLAEVVARLRLDDEIGQALVARRGPLGRLIDLCEALEQADFDAAEVLAGELHVPLDGVMTAQNVALAWAHGFVPADPPPPSSLR